MFRRQQEKGAEGRFPAPPGKYIFNERSFRDIIQSIKRTVKLNFQKKKISTDINSRAYYVDRIFIFDLNTSEIKKKGSLPLVTRIGDLLSRIRGPVSRSGDLVSPMGDTLFILRDRA